MRQWRRATVATPGEWQCKTGGVRRLAVANGPNIFQMLLVNVSHQSTYFAAKYNEPLVLRTGGGGLELLTANLTFYTKCLGQWTTMNNAIKDNRLRPGDEYLLIFIVEQTFVGVNAVVPLLCYHVAAYKYTCSAIGPIT